MPDDTTLSAVIASYLEAVDRGERPDRDQLLAAHPHLYNELRDFLAAEGQLEAVAGPLRAMPMPDDPATTGGSDPGVKLHEQVHYFGDYRLHREIARGGMGVVYAAQQVRLNRPVALKMILAGALADERDVRRFRDEAEAAANLDHPHIVPIYEVGEHQGQHYFSMKLIEGGSLAQALPRYRNDFRGIGRLVATVARAVHHAHQRGILHRDIKPGNILIDTEGQPHVSDFGLARKLDVEKGQTQSGALVGTPEYMSPEQARAQTNLTTAVDVYSLGAVLYALLTGRPPFQGDNLPELLRQVVELDPSSPRSVNATVPPDLATVCLKCLAKDPARRYASAEALAEDLEAWLDAQPIKARPVGRVERLHLWCSRNPVVAVLSAAAALLLVAIVGVWIVSRNLVDKAADDAGAARLTRDRAEELRREEEAKRKKEEEKGIAERIAEEDRKAGLVYLQEMWNANEAWEENRVERVRELLEKHRPAPGRLDHRSWEWDYLHAQIAGHRFTFHAGEGGFRGASFSPDGARLATFAGSHNGQRGVTVWDLATGKAVARLSGSTDRRQWFAWAPDGKRYAWGAREITKIADAATGQVIGTLAAGADTLLWAPDGKMLALLPYRAPAQVWEATGKKVHEFPAGQLLCWSADGGRLCATSGATVRLWDRKVGQVARELKLPVKENPPGWNLHLPAIGSFSPDGKNLALATWGGEVFFVDPEAGRVTATYPGTVKTSSSDHHLFLVWDADGRRVHWVCGGVTRVIDTAGTLVAETEENINHISLSPDRRILTVWTKENRWGYYNVAARERTTGRETPLPWNTNLVEWGPNGKLVVVRRLIRGPSYFEVAQVHDLPPTSAPSRLGPLVQGERVDGLSGPYSLRLPLRWSHDGRQLVSLRIDGTAAVYDAATGKKLQTLGVPSRDLSLYATAWSPDGKRVATGSRSGVVSVWDPSTGKRALTLPGIPGEVRTLSWSPDGARLLASSQSATRASPWRLLIWEAATGKEIYKSRHSVSDNSFAWNQDATRLAFRHSSELWLVDVVTGKELHTHTFRNHTFPFAWNSDGKLIFVRDQGKLVVLDADGKEIYAREALGLGQAWSPDGTRLAFCSNDEQKFRLHVLEAGTGRELVATEALTPHFAGWAPDGKRLVFRDDRQAKYGFRLVDAATGKEDIKLPTISSTNQFRVVWNPDNRLLAVDLHPTLRIVDTKTGKNVFHDPTASESYPAWDPAGARLAWGSGGAPEGVKVWDVKSDKLLWARPTQSTERYVFWSPDGRWLACKSSGIHVWDAATGNEVLKCPGDSFGLPVWSADSRRLLVHRAGKALTYEVESGREVALGEAAESVVVRAVDWHPRQAEVATGSRNGLVHLWDPASGARTRTLGELAVAALLQAKELKVSPLREETVLESTTIAAIAYSPDGHRLAASTAGGTVRVWDTRTWELAGGWQVSKERVGFTRKQDPLSLAWSPDGQKVALGGFEAVEIRQVASGKLVREIQGQVGSIIWEGDGKRLAATRGDHTAVVLDAATGETLFTLHGERNTKFDALAWSADGRRLATAGDQFHSGRGSYAVKLWDAATGQPLLVLHGPALPLSLAWSRDGRKLAAQSLRDTMPIYVWETPRRPE